MLSGSVANAIEYYKIPRSGETSRFCRIFNKAFDCLNVRSLCNSEANRRGYKSADDERLNVKIP